MQYHFWHALALIALALASPHIAAAWSRISAFLFLAGVLVFCGSLYALALGAPRLLGMLAPFGGVALILGWLAFAVGALRA